MRQRILLAAALLAVSPALRAQTRAVHPSAWVKTTHYLRTHRELLANDVLIVAPLGADAGSSVHCQAISQGCVEENPILGRRPSPAATWSLAMGEAGGLIALDHLLWKLTRSDKLTGHLIWMGTLPLDISELFNVKANVNTAEGLQNARRRVGK
jgi:hypothetical protein